VLLALPGGISTTIAVLDRHQSIDQQPMVGSRAECPIL
jgi:hypothetical protein